jgi:hypothetical protein
LKEVKEMIKVNVNEKEYLVNLNYSGESEIFNSEGVKVNDNISTNLYYRIVLAAKKN